MRTFYGALIFSLSIHAFLGFSVLPPKAHQGTQSAMEPIQISYTPFKKPVIYEKKVEEVKVFKKIKTRQPKYVIQSPEKSIAKKVSSLQAREARAPISKPTEPVSRPKSATDFMTDPQKGKVFFDYFGRLKEKIHQTVRRRYHGDSDSLGVVSLNFILNPDGSLARAVVLERESDADRSLQKIALDSLRVSAPFGEFPAELGRTALSFNLKVYFDELDHE